MHESTKLATKVCVNNQIEHEVKSKVDSLAGVGDSKSHVEMEMSMV